MECLSGLPAQADTLWRNKFKQIIPDRTNPRREKIGGAGVTNLKNAVKAKQRISLNIQII